MDLSVLNPVEIFAALIVAATPLVFAALGELVVEKSGALNLGVEGMMILGAIGGFATAQASGSLWLAVLAGAGAGAALALLFAVMTQYLMSNQVATGLALTLFGLGLAALLGRGYAGLTLDVSSRIEIPALTDLPVVGRLVFGHDP
ncbi:MAG: ABC transporter permease subunit, partial [Pikeienuella sp.]